MNLTKNKGGVYVASFKTIEGKTKSISTKCTDKAEAQRVVKDSGLAAMEQAAKAGRLSREAIGHITTGRKLTMEKAVSKWEEWMHAVGKAPKTIRNNLSVVAAWLRDKHLSLVPPSAITEKHISDWINATGEEKASTRTVNLSSIRSFFAFTSSRGWSVGNPAMLVRVQLDKLDHEQKEPTVREPFNAQEVKRLMTYLEKHGLIFWRFAVAASYELGLRLGDICQLEWGSFSKGKLIVWTDKRNKRLEFPISEELAQLSCEIPVHSEQYVFPEEREMIIDPDRRSILSVYFRRHCERAGIKGRSFHSLRHSAATNKFAKADKETLAKKLAEVLSVAEIGQLLGHANAKTTKGYIH